VGVFAAPHPGSQQARTTKDSPNPRYPYTLGVSLRSPPEQVGEGQPGATELPIDPNAEVVQRYTCRQTSSQTLKLVRSLLASTNRARDAQKPVRLVADLGQKRAKVVLQQPGMLSPPHGEGPGLALIAGLGRVLVEGVARQIPRSRRDGGYVGRAELEVGVRI
jgi:hypothetical protein